MLSGDHFRCPSIWCHSSDFIWLCSHPVRLFRLVLFHCKAITGKCAGSNWTHLAANSQIRQYRGHSNGRWSRSVATSIVCPLMLSIQFASMDSRPDLKISDIITSPDGPHSFPVECNTLLPQCKHWKWWAPRTIKANPSKLLEKIYLSEIISPSVRRARRHGRAFRIGGFLMTNVPPPIILKSSY